MPSMISKAMRLSKRLSITFRTLDIVALVVGWPPQMLLRVDRLILASRASSDFLSPASVMRSSSLTVTFLLFMRLSNLLGDLLVTALLGGMFFLVVIDKVLHAD